VSARIHHFGVIVAVIVLVSAIGGGVGATTGGSDVTTNESATGNTTTPHENPDEIQADGDDRRVATYLASRLGDRLTESALAISAGEYERGRAPLDEEYGELLDQYAVVARDLDEEELAEQFNLTREQQRSVIREIEELEATRAEYERAVEAGDEERRRELARELLEGAAELNQTATELTQRYETLENETEIDFGEAQLSIEEAQLQVGQAAALIEQREFTATRLVARTNRTTVSVSDPATVSGQLTTVNDTPVANGLIRIRIGADTVTTRTDQNGTFTATYRPLLASTATSNVTVVYEPTEADPYLPATETVPISIEEQANSSVTLATTTDAVAFDQTVRATGTVRVPDAPAGAIGGIPIVLTVDGRRLATAETGPNGEVDTDGVLPASVPPGETELEVGIDRRDAAVARSAATDSLTVQSTPTTLSLNATADDGQNVTVTGGLRTDRGGGLAGREVAIAVGRTDGDRLETDNNGRYRETFAVPSDTEGDESVTVTATFDGAGTNLEDSTATQQVTVAQLGRASEASGGGGIDDTAENITLRQLLIGGVTVAGALLVLGRRSVRRWGRRLGSRVGVTTGSATAGTADSATTADAATATADVNADASGETESSGSPFDRAQTALSAGQPDNAVQIAYAAMRSRLQLPESDTAATHWEFYRRLQDDASVDRTQLRTVTEAYETAAFAPNPVSADTAADAVTASDELTGGREQQDH
jgi:hypothetical protein